MRDTQKQRHRQREKQGKAEGEPDMGLDPGTPGSCPGLKAGTKPLSHPGIPTSSHSFRLFPSSEIFLVLAVSPLSSMS